MKCRFNYENYECYYTNNDIVVHYKLIKDKKQFREQRANSRAERSTSASLSHALACIFAVAKI